ncbi:MAG: type II secretion system protein [bacterium]|nr:type II secretion system protein [bacterium]
MKGFTVIEILVAIGISSMLFVGMAILIATALPVYRSTFVQTSVNDTARVQLKRIANEIREARVSDEGSYPIVEATGFKLVFYADIDGDDATERVRYELVGAHLERGIINPIGNPAVYDEGQEVVSTVSSFVYNGSSPLFTYYGSDYPTNSNPLVLP